MEGVPAFFHPNFVSKLRGADILNGGADRSSRIPRSNRARVAQAGARRTEQAMTAHPML